MSDAKANVDSYIERLEKPAGVPPFIQREAAMIMRHQQAEIERLKAVVDAGKDALEKLSRLGNEPHLGNSDGNVIAQNALSKIAALEGDNE